MPSRFKQTSSSRNCGNVVTSSSCVRQLQELVFTHKLKAMAVPAWCQQSRSEKDHLDQISLRSERTVNCTESLPWRVVGMSITHSVKRVLASSRNLFRKGCKLPWCQVWRLTSECLPNPHSSLMEFIFPTEKHLIWIFHGLNLVWLLQKLDFPRAMLSYTKSELVKKFLARQIFWRSFISWGLMCPLLRESLHYHGQATVVHVGSSWLFK